MKSGVCTTTIKYIEYTMVLMLMMTMTRANNEWEYIYKEEKKDAEWMV